MPNPENLEGQGFHTDPDRINRAGKKPGTLNRKTLLKRILDLESKRTIEGFEDTVTRELVVMDALVTKAEQGDVSAIKEIQDTLHGKLKETVETQHTFTQMGNVKIGGGKAGEEALGFDVGKETDNAVEDDDE